MRQDWPQGRYRKSWAKVSILDTVFFWKVILIFNIFEVNIEVWPMPNNVDAKCPDPTNAIFIWGVLIFYHS